MRVLVLLGLLTTYVLPLGARPVAVYTGVATEWAVDDVVHSDRIAIAPSVCAVFGGPESKRGRVGLEYMLGLWSHYDTREIYFDASSIPPGYSWSGHHYTDQDGWFGSYEGIRVVGRDFHRGQPSGIKAGLGVGLHQLWPIVQPDRFAERRTLGGVVPSGADECDGGIQFLAPLRGRTQSGSGSDLSGLYPAPMAAAHIGTGNAGVAVYDLAKSPC